ncbi:MAG: CotH kinase family protein [Oscillospiraceae bacterium]|nr:CotH kinase family protein [Oscillospiraceae bacterium]
MFSVFFSGFPDFLHSADFGTVAGVLVAEGLLGLLLLRSAGVLRSWLSVAVSTLLMLAALALRAGVFQYETLDYQDFLSHWVDVFRDYGGFQALNLPIGNYNIPYLYFMALFSQLPLRDLYLIKLLSTLSDLLLAWAAMLLCRRFTSGSTRPLCCFFTVLFLPTVWLNSAVWGQCDSLYAAPLLLGIFCALDDRPWCSVILAAVAFAFKLQAVFLLPVYAVFLMTGKLRWKHILAFPLSYLALVLPAVLFGRPFWETVTLYFSQTGSIGSGLNYNSPSVFAVFTEIQDEERAAAVAIVLAFVFMLNLLAVAWARRRQMNDRALLSFSLLLAIGIPFLLPHMHERYFYCADILAVVLAFSVPLYAACALLVQWASLLGYHAYLKQRYLLLMNHGATALIAAFALTLVCFLQSVRETGSRRKRGSQQSPQRDRRRPVSGFALLFPVLFVMLCRLPLQPPAFAESVDAPISVSEEPAAADPGAETPGPDVTAPESGAEDSTSGVTAAEASDTTDALPEIEVVIPQGAARSARKGDIVITEIMVKNRTTVQDEDGDFPDWVELLNASGEDIVLEGWSISDRDRKAGLVFPAFLFPADSRCVIFCSGKDRPMTLHTPFSLSAGETVLLKDPAGNVISEAECADLAFDRSYALRGDGRWKECLYPTPGRPNTSDAYDAWQDEWELNSPLLLNEACVSDVGNRFPDYGGSDWVELKNNSNSQISLVGWYLSDDPDDYMKYPLPSSVLEPGQLTVVRCDNIGLSLGDDNESLFLSHKDYGLCDRLSLRDIPTGGSYGRLRKRNGSYFFADASPGQENIGGYRRVSAMPEAITPDGVFDGSEQVTVELQAEGSIYYTTDSTVPTTHSARWSGSVQMNRTGILRAIACEQNALPSRPLTLSYFIREGHSLPVLSLVSDNKDGFWRMYSTAVKDREYSGNLAFYSEDAQFSLPCGISMHGETSLALPKKGMSVRFRGAYGAESLECDLFGGGVTSFTNLLIRAGQDQSDAIIRNELCENLALSVSDNIIGSRSRYCVLYIDGEYRGIYALSEKLNEQHYANIAGVSKKSVTIINAEAPLDSDLYLDVFKYCETHDMSDRKNYEHFLSLMDVDSLIDWVFLEGYFGNADLTFGNLRYCRSSENDGKWRFMFYDLDATLRDATRNHRILLRRNSVQCMQISYLMSDLIKNAEFRDRFLSRSAELIDALSNNVVFREIDRLTEQVRPEVARDTKYSNRSVESWEKSIQTLKNFLISYDWPQHNVDAICSQLYVDAGERAKYFS